MEYFHVITDARTGEVTQVPFTEEEVAEAVANEAINSAKFVRQQRDALLVASDWTQVADAPVDKQAWATYRQALRDITLQAGFPTDVVFPEAPTGAQ